MLKKMKKVAAITTMLCLLGANTVFGVWQRFVLFGTTLINITFTQPGKGNSVLA